MRTRDLFSLVILGSSSPFASACGDATPAPVAPVTTVTLDGGASSATTTAAAPADPSDAGVASAADAQTAGDFFSCSTDSDCVRVAKNGCCNNGYMEAVNKSQADAYKASFTCEKRRPCPMFRIHEMRQAQCSPDAHKCVLAMPDGGASFPALPPSP
jgi:hypothetical protein